MILMHKRETYTFIQRKIETNTESHIIETYNKHACPEN